MNIALLKTEVQQQKLIANADEILLICYDIAEAERLIEAAKTLGRFGL